MTTSNLSINTAPQAKNKRIGAAIALAMFSSLIGLSATTSSAYAYGYSMSNGLGGYDYYFDDGSTGYSLPNGLGGYDYY